VEELEHELQASSTEDFLRVLTADVIQFCSLASRLQAAFEHRLHHPGSDTTA
jgi:hypothetical protein